MAILPGTRLGPYDILSPIGAGGMGEVYRARDTRLDRVVAIKVLPEGIADKPGLRERFEREARVIASLNHPHICVLHDIGHQDPSTDFLVMEYLEGETLAERLRKGSLPLEQVLAYATEIADALDKAHRTGVTHRDLKPSNVMLTKGGVKLLDFGLAKLQPAGALAGMSAAATVTSPLTGHGTILGTLHYMAPEQAEGNEADARSDIFSFGAIVYEMATGRKAFDGKSAASVIAKILEYDPPAISEARSQRLRPTSSADARDVSERGWGPASVEEMTPPALDRVVKKCLRKDPDDRWQSARDVKDELKWIAEGGSQTAMVVPARSDRTRQQRFAWIAASTVGVVALAAIAALMPYGRRTTPAATQAVRFTVGPPERGTFSPNLTFLAVSPDGSKLAFVGTDANRVLQLWIRALDSPTAQALPGTENAAQPFWSPDSRFVAFFAGGKLKKVAVSGGPVQTMADAPPQNGGGTWSRDGVILFTAAPNNTISRVSAAGGAVTRITTLDPARQESVVSWPQFLPDGHHFLFFALSAKTENNAIYVASLDSKERKVLLNASSNPVYVPPGYLLFYRQTALMAQPFDAARLQLTGEAVPIAEGLQFNPVNFRAAFSASENGVLAYRTALSAAPLALVWVDRTGKEQRLAAPGHNYVLPRLSPDGQRVAAGIEEAESQIWVYDSARDTLTRLTFEGTNNIDPVWTPDGKRIVFKGQGNRLFWQPADGSGGAEALTDSRLSANNIPGSWSPDGQALVFTQEGATRNIWILPLKDRKPQPFVQSPSYETAPRFSPDGRWIAYDSTESGRDEIYVRPYPGPGGKWQISTDGGTEPVWNPKGRELFYRNGAKMMAVDVSTQATFSAGKPRTLFEGLYVPTPRTFPNYDVSPDGQRFLMLKGTEQAQAPAQINVVLNWIEELKRRGPAGTK